MESLENRLKNEVMEDARDHIGRHLHVQLDDQFRSLISSILRKQILEQFGMHHNRDFFTNSVMISEESMKKIERLTPEQEAYLPVFRQEYLDIALSPKRIDPDTLVISIGDAYRHIGEQQPRLIICDSPYRCMIAIQVLEDMGLELSDDEVHALVESYIESGETKKRNMFKSSFLWGSQDMYWIAWGRFAEYIGVEFDATTRKLLDIVERIGRECEWWWPFKNIVVASQKPISTHWDDENRLHYESGPAIQYDDGYTLMAWHGIRIPREWIQKRDEIDPTLALTWENIEQRRALSEMIGWGKVIEQLNPVIIDTDPDPMIGELIEVDIPDIGRERFLRVKCPTGRDFVLAPVNSNVETAREANAGTWRLSGIEYNPEIQT